MSLVWSYGGGTQSAAIAALIARGDLPVPDLAVIADTGREVATTWTYLSDVVAPALAGRGLAVNVIDHADARVDLYGSDGHTLLIPAFTTRNGRGRLPTYCSSEWKRDTVRRWLRQHGVTDCDVWLGISTDEAHRMKPSGLAWYRHEYPLIDARLSRAGCVALVESLGWPTPPKSRCWMCPHQGERSWLALAATDDWPKAVALDRYIRTKDPDVFVHSRCEPLPAAVQYAAQQPDLFDACDSGYCWT